MKEERGWEREGQRELGEGRRIEGGEGRTKRREEGGGEGGRIKIRRGGEGRGEGKDGRGGEGATGADGGMK